jgi:putative nucleotidyltransferase with HDIG domain
MVILGWLVRPIRPNEALTLLYLAVGTQIAALRPIPWRTGYQSVIDPLLTATGLYAPGAGVAMVAWFAVFDGRVPGRSTTWWAFLFNRAMSAVSHVVPSIVVASIGDSDAWLPVRTVIYVVATVGINYLVTALLFSYVRRVPILTTFVENVGVTTVIATLALSFSGGIIRLLLENPIGYVMAPGLFGFVLAVRGNVADAQRQTLLKDQTLELAAQALDARDRYTESHSIRVAELAGRLGEHLELGDREVELIRTAGSLHDLGKIGVRDDILNKPGPLTEAEWEIMRRHPDIGADMIVQHSALAEVAPLVRHHHERWDGTGYPAGMKGDVIPFGARILSVADSFDTITGARLYRRSAMTPIEGVEDISRRANQWYDPNVVDALRELHGLHPLEVSERPDVPRRITTLRVLRSNPGFSSLIAAIGVSSLGDPLTQVASLVSIYLATTDARLVALGLIVQALGTILMTGVFGGIADRFSRRNLIVGMEVLRAGLLVATAFLVTIDWRFLIPILLLLSAISAIVQPAKQAAVPSLVPSGQVGKANALIGATTMLSGAVGFAIAGAILTLVPRSTNILFVADAATFVLAAAIIVGIPNLGGGSATTKLSGAIRRSWAIAGVRIHLVLATLAALLISMSYPALLALAYQISKQAGGQTYSLLELISSAGIFAGSILIGRFTAIGTLRAAGMGLLLTGAFSVAVWMSSSITMIAIALFIASVGNPVYAIANQTALLEAADRSNRGSVMATRFGFVQTAIMIGAAVGGVVTNMRGPKAAFAVLGIGLISLALYAIAAGRTTTNPLHGAAYEEAALQRAKT